MVYLYVKQYTLHLLSQSLCESRLFILIMVIDKLKLYSFMIGNVLIMYYK